jgi:hypothetical protein
MILIRVEPVSSGNFPMSVQDKRAAFLRHMPETRQERMGKKFDEQDIGNVIGCWFTPAYVKTDNQLDVIVYANDIIKRDHKDSDIRIIAVEIPDDEVDQYRVSNMPDDSFAMIRSKNPDVEYLLPTSVIAEKASVIMIVSRDELLQPSEYRKSLEDFEKSIFGSLTNKSSRQRRETLWPSC